MNIFSDLHHGDLFYSLQLLFEKRLGYNLYRPIGMDWFNHGYWDIGNPYPNPADTAKQYLGIDDRTWDPYKNLNADYHIEDGIYMVYDPVHNTHQKAITFQKFKDMQIDAVISSYPFGHDETYARLIKDHKPNAKQITQMGNIYQHTEVSNVLCSTLPYPTDKHVVFYHQEFDLENYYPSISITPKKIIRSFVNLLPRSELFNGYSQYLSEFIFESYGAGNANGTISSDKEIANLMRDSMFGWHIKPGGDGFGHVIHNWYACGKPVITNGSDYQDKLAGQLLTHGITCIDLEQGNFEENVQRIKWFSQPDNYMYLALNAKTRFMQVVNYEEEAEKVKEFLSNLV